MPADVGRGLAEGALLAGNAGATSDAARKSAFSWMPFSSSSSCWFERPEAQVQRDDEAVLATLAAWLNASGWSW